MGSLLFFLGGKNIVYPLWQSSFVKVSGNQKKKRLFFDGGSTGSSAHGIG
jgi:hypothetical protein